MNSHGIALLWCVLQVTTFCCVACLIYLLVRRISPRAGVLTTLASLIVVMGLSVLALSPWPEWNLQPVRSASTSQQASHSEPGIQASNSNLAPTPAGPGKAEHPANSTQALGWNDTLMALRRALVTGSQSAAAAPDWRWPAVLFLLALAAAAAGVLYLLAGMWAVRRLVKQSRPIATRFDVGRRLSEQLAGLQTQLPECPAITLFESSEITTPIVVGWRRPSILLPSAWREWTAQQQEAVLAHELAHVVSQDFLSGVLARLAVSMHVYHPLVHWLASRLQLEQELAADAHAVSLTGDRVGYLQTLAELALATPPTRFAGPVQTFIPTRSQLLRRVEMLGTLVFDREIAERPSRKLRWATCGVLALLGLAVAGIRGPTAPAVAQSEAAQTEESDTSPPTLDPEDESGEARDASGYDFNYVPEEFMLMAAIRPSAIESSAHLKPFAKLIQDSTRPSFPSEKLEQASLVLTSPLKDEETGKFLTGSGSEFTIWKLNQPVSIRPALEKSYGPILSQKYQGKEILTWGGSDASEFLIAFHAPDEHTLLGQNRFALKRTLDDPQAARPSATAERWKEVATGPLVIIADVAAMRKMLPGGNAGDLNGGNRPFPWQLLAPLVNAVETAIVTLDDQQQLALKGQLVCRRAEDVVSVEQTLRSLLVLAGNLLSSFQQATVANQQTSEIPAPLLKLAADALKNSRLEAQGKQLNVIVPLGDAKEVTNAVVPWLREASKSAKQSQGVNNLKQLSLALLNYVSLHDRFPPAVFRGKSIHGEAMNATGDDASDVTRSWRVELLPFLGQEALYKQYRLDESWDSVANKKVLGQMPMVFRSPLDDAGSTNTSYFALVGPGTVFEGTEGTKLLEITDGTSSTIALVEAKRNIPWTKPEDIPYDPSKPLPKLGEWNSDGLFAAFADGSVHKFRSDEIEQNLRRWIERNDGKPVMWPNE